MSYPGHSLGVESFFSAVMHLVYSTATADWADQNKLSKTCWALLEKQGETHKQHSYGLLHMDTLVLAKQQKLTVISVYTLDAV